MSPEVEEEPTPDKTTSSLRKSQHDAERDLGRGQAQQTLLRFQGSCEELKGWDAIAQYIIIKFTYGTELKSSIDKLKKIMLARPSMPAETAAQLDIGIFKEEVREYMQERKALEQVTKQAHVLVWGQCSRPMGEQL
eukprot:14989502-Ditylum_brightwellii.AAC.2